MGSPNHIKSMSFLSDDLAEGKKVLKTLKTICLFLLKHTSQLQGSEAVLLLLYSTPAILTILSFHMLVTYQALFSYPNL